VTWYKDGKYLKTENLKEGSEQQHFFSVTSLKVILIITTVNSDPKVSSSKAKIDENFSNYFLKTRVKKKLFLKS